MADLRVLMSQRLGSTPRGHISTPHTSRRPARHAVSMGNRRHRPIDDSTACRTANRSTARLDRCPSSIQGRTSAGQVQSRVGAADRAATPLAAPLAGSDLHSTLSRHRGRAHRSTRYSTGTENTLSSRAAGARPVRTGPARGPEAGAGRSPARPGAGHSGPIAGGAR